MVQEFKPLTGLRFLACLIVFASHLPAWAMPTNRTFDAITDIVIGQATIVMPFFFMLSGFVLTHVYAERVAFHEPARPNRPGITNFMIRRLARLWPPHVLCVALILPLVLWEGTLEFGQLLAHLTLTHALVPSGRYYAGLNTPSWAMSAELVFSLCFPLVILVLFRLGSKGRIALLAAAFILPQLAAAAITAAGLNGMFLLYINPFARMAEFVAGATFYLLSQNHRHRLQGLHWELLAFAICIASMIFTVNFPRAFTYWPVFMPATLFVIAVFAEGTGALSRFFGSEAMRFMGRLSFAFYLIHFVVIRYAGTTPLAELTPDNPWRWIVIPVLLALAILCALPIHLGFESAVEPKMRRYIQALWDKRLIRKPRAAS